MTDWVVALVATGSLLLLVEIVEIKVAVDEEAGEKGGGVLTTQRKMDLSSTTPSEGERELELGVGAVDTRLVVTEPGDV